jgi:hypothetical protein
MVFAHGARRFPRLAAFYGGVALVLSVFVAKNVVQHRGALVVGGTGVHMFGRVAVVDRRLPDSDLARRLIAVSARHGVADPLFQNAGWRLHGWLWGEGVSPVEADGMLRTVALQTYAAHPIATLKDTLSAMASMVEAGTPVEYVLWLGVRPENFDRHVRISDQVWENSDLMRSMRAQLPPYRGHPMIGDWVYRFLERWGAIALAPRGLWVIPAMALACLAGALLRAPVIFFLSAVAFTELVGTALGDQPYQRYWDPCVPAFVLGIGLAIAEAAGWAARIARSNDPSHDSPSRDFMEPNDR